MSTNLEIFDYEQGSPEWFECRRGIPTASKFSAVLAGGSGKTRYNYMNMLAEEILSGKIAEGFISEHTDRGKVMEEEAREFYKRLADEEVSLVGFLRNGRKGSSPDALVGQTGGLEIKTALPHIQTERLKRGKLPNEYKAQVQGNLMISERDWWDFLSYWPDMPVFRTRVYRDEAYIQNLSAEIDRFNEELDEMVQDISEYYLNSDDRR